MATNSSPQPGFVSIIALSLMAGSIWAVPAFAELECRSKEALGGGLPSETAVECGTPTTVSAQAGYRFITPDGGIAAASPYGRLKSGVAGGFSAARLGTDLKLALDGTFLHEDDYHSELFFDYSGLVRIHADSEALWHNLLREQIVVNPNLLPGSLITLNDKDAGRTYGMRVATNLVETRIKLGNNPFHLNFGYWELHKEGNEQLRFSDQYFGQTNLQTDRQNSVTSESRRIDRTTREGVLGLDGHLGPVDISYGFRIRDFINNAADSRATFNNNISDAAIGQPQAHDVIPDSRVTTHSIKLFTDLSGGLVGSAAYSLVQRENNGGHGDAVPSRSPSDTIHAVAGDLSYTPFRELSVALKYRHREINRETPANTVNPFGLAGPVSLSVLPAIDTVRDTVSLITTIRPVQKMTLRLEYLAELESRSNVWERNPQTNSLPIGLHDDSRQTHTGSASFLWNPAKELKLNASYSYAVSDNPAYGTSFSDRHNGKLAATYTHSGIWGVTGTYLVQYESGESRATTVSTVPVANYVLPRNSRSDSANASVWFSPVQRLTLTGNYSYLVAKSDQTMLLSELITTPNPQVVGSYRSTAHVYGIDAMYALNDALDLSVALQQVRSKSRFDLPFRSFTLVDSNGNIILGDTVGISDLSKIDSTETGISTRMDLRITALIGCVLEYGYRRYDSGNPSIDGSVHTTMLQLKARW